MPKKKVTVFGAGVAGLTAAHELVIRGFDVKVIDPEINDFINPWTLDRGIGGMARSQFVVDMDQSVDDGVLRQLRPATDFLLDVTVRADELGPISERLRHLAKELKGLGSLHSLHIWLPVASSEHDISKDDRYRKLQTTLEGVLSSDELTSIVEPEVTKEKHRLETIWFDTGFTVLPSEHGFRFFPSFYRHLFDTMKRTPLVAPRLFEAGRATTFDNLVAVEALGFAREGKKTSFLLPRRAPASFEEFRVNIEKVLGELEWSTEDLARFSLKMFEYMTSSTARREKEYEHMSWSEFVDLPSYSPTMQEHVEFGPQMMLSLRGSKSDARTQGNAVVQLFLDQLRVGENTDCILNAPTSGAWFDHWHRYLVRQGVKFYHGAVSALTVENERVVPVVTTRAKVDWKADYYVLALPILPMEEVAKTLEEKHGHVFERKDARDLAAIAHFRSKEDEENGESPLADMNGILFFFDTEVRFWSGHTQYLDSEWGLTSIAQPQFWAKRREPGDGYRSVLSVDIGIWDRPTRPELGDRARKDRPISFKKAAIAVMAANSPPKDLAREVWAQIEDHHDEAFAASYGKNARFPLPTTFALDQALTFVSAPGEVGASARYENRYPFLVNVVGQYPRRPGAMAQEAPKAEPHYAMCDGIVLAGTHMKTFTRITSMEAANESARHAVNAILEASETAADRCEIWDPEDHELPELKALRDIDEHLCRSNRPHMAKILDWSELPMSLPDLRRIDLGGGIFR